MDHAQARLWRSTGASFTPGPSYPTNWKRHPEGWRLAEAVGFEPTDPSLDHSISSRGRYDHFDTLP